MCLGQAEVRQCSRLRVLMCLCVSGCVCVCECVCTCIVLSHLSHYWLLITCSMPSPTVNLLALLFFSFLPILFILYFASLLLCCFYIECNLKKWQGNYIDSVNAAVFQSFCTLFLFFFFVFLHYLLIRFLFNTTSCSSKVQIIINSFFSL